jgi:pyrroloquinoline quinone (PQQ) biosynthesis protein C
MRALQSELLAIMDQKNHWAWTHLTLPGLSRAALTAHFRHEFLTYVRDFPVLLARVLAQGPPDEVRIALARNIAEEQTGVASFGTPHPEMFLEMMDGLAISRDDVVNGPLEPEARVYRALLDRVSAGPPWYIGAAVLTVFVEGSVNERAERARTRREPPIEHAIAAHPMVKWYGCPPSAMRLARAHRAVEGDHRNDAWDMLLRHVPETATAEGAVVDAVRVSHAAWLAYRDGVARAMGLVRDSGRFPALAPGDQ